MSKGIFRCQNWGCDRHLVGRGQGGCQMAFSAQEFIHLECQHAKVEKFEETLSLETD